jgi:SAM-dependent methyltransferase
MPPRLRRLGRNALHRLGLLNTFHLLRAVRPSDLVAHCTHRGERFPVPGARLRVSTAGTADLSWFLEGGRLGARALREAVALVGREFGSMERVLDFGCGCGRVLRHLAEAAGPEIYGADLNGAAVRWCARCLPLAGALENDLEPPLELPDEHFGLIYAFSVFTHLPPGLAERWTDELRRLLKPGGLLVLSTHGDAYRDQLLPEERAEYDAGGVVVRAAATAGSNACGVYHPPEFVRTRLGRGLEPLRLVPEGAKGNPRQDLAIFRRP